MIIGTEDMVYIPPDTMLTIMFCRPYGVTYPRILSFSCAETDFANRKSTKAGLQFISAAIISALYPVNLTLLFELIPGLGQLYIVTLTNHEYTSPSA